ncbi:MAG: ATP-binding protein [Microscillaceae bacterium]
MSQWFVISISGGYLLILFLIAYWGDRRARASQSLINNPWVYTLSLTVYCTAWTYYGSVGRAATSGLDFLTTYLGPTLLMPFWWMAMRKIIRICRAKHLTTIADFISSRYGKSSTLAVVVSLVSILAATPYIALQLKAISASFLVITQSGNLQEPSLVSDSAFYIMLALTLFTVLFGTRNIETTERHEGLVAAIAFESMVKLVAFLAIGLFVTYSLFGGLDDIFAQARQVPALQKHFTFQENNQESEWFLMLLLSALAFMFLPRQFQVSVIENVSIRHLNQALWLFPLYLFLINLFVIPIAFAGHLHFGQQDVDADTYVLALPLFAGQHILAVFVYLGGFSAATSMIIVSTIALSVMLSNNLIMPVMVRIPMLKKSYAKNLVRFILYIRRLSIVLILHLAYVYYKLVAENTALVSIGLISFVGMAQFAPAMLGGIYWKSGNRIGALSGLLVGFSVWAYTLILPSAAAAGLMSDAFVREGLGGLTWLRPHAFLGLDSLSPISQAFFWSLLLNTLTYLFCSAYLGQSSTERHEAEVFVDIHKYYTAYDNTVIWKGTAHIRDLENLLINFLGKDRARQALEQFSSIYGKDWQKNPQADAYLIAYVERLLSGTIGVAAARTLIVSVVKEEEEIRIEEVFDILRESQELIQLNRELREKSLALEQASQQLREANQQLQQADLQKNEFISTITHEMRTPITSIRAFSEILFDNDDLDIEEKKHFLSTIIKETNRMERLINQVLDLEKFESGRHKLKEESLDLNEIIREAADSVGQLLQEKQIQLHLKLAPLLPPVWGDRDRILQVVLNLLSNALKFCQDSIEVQSVSQVDRVQIGVYDNGRGIKAELRDLIFEKFYQAEDQNIRKPKGSGLGLAICKKIVEYHRGKIWVESEPGHFARFIFELPIQKAPTSTPALPVLPNVSGA